MAAENLASEQRGEASRWMAQTVLLRRCPAITCFCGAEAHRIINTPTAYCRTGLHPGAPEQEAQQQQHGTGADREGGAATAPLGAAVAALIAWYGGCLASVKAAEALVRPLSIPAGRAYALTLLLRSLAQLGLAAALLHVMLRKHSAHVEALLLLTWRPWRDWAQPLQDAISVCLLAVQIAGVMPVLGPGQADAQAELAVQQIASTDWAARGLLLAAAVLLGPAAEELMFRGLLLPSLSSRLPPWVAVAVSSVVFALAHRSLDAFRLLSGLVYGSLYIRTHNLWPPIFMHGLWNAFGICVVCITRSIWW